MQGQNHVQPVTVKNPLVIIKYGVPSFMHTSLRSKSAEYIRANVQAHTVPECL